MLDETAENKPEGETTSEITNKIAENQLAEEQNHSVTEEEKEEEQSEPIVEEKPVAEKKEENVEAETTEDEVKVEETTEVTPPKKEEVKIDYAKLSLEELVAELQKVIKNGEVHQIKNDVDAIKNSFNPKFGELLTEKKKAFLEEGGNEIDFHYSSPIKKQYNDLLFEYKVKRDAYYKQQEDELKNNLSKRLELIEELKHLIDNAEPSTMYKDFKDLQDKWKAVGRIPHTKYNDVWRTYHHHVERFYDLLHLRNDLRDLDFKHNLEEKLKLVERAEELVNEPDATKSFKELQVLHRLWKEDIGPVAKEYREDVWNRFSEATKKIHDKRHEAQKHLEVKYQENLIKKQAVVEQIKQLASLQLTSHSDWQQKIKELEALRQQFFKIGKVPRANNNDTWQAFKDATRDFNRSKNAFYKDVKKMQQDNLNKKMQLVEQAESLKDSDDWDAVTPIMKKIQNDWKTIGHVPKKYSDDIWKRFKDACNAYFDRLHGKQDEANKEQIEVFNKKKELLENLKSQADGDQVLTLELIQAYVKDWNGLGSVPHNMRHIEPKFNKVLDKLYGKLDMDKTEVAMLKFKSIVDGYHANNDTRKLDSEQLFVRRKIDEVTREIQQLENNISFISNATDDNPLVKSVRNNITSYEEDLKIWKTKLSYLTSLDY